MFGNNEQSQWPIAFTEPTFTPNTPVGRGMITREKRKTNISLVNRDTSTVKKKKEKLGFYKEAVGMR